MLQPFLFIGVGGSGGKTLRVIREELDHRLRAAGWDRDFPDAWQFLHVDVPKIADGDDPDLPPQLPKESYVGLVQQDIKYKSVDAAIMTGAHADQSLLESFAGWRPNPDL